MSYRNYIAVVDKESLDKIRNLPYDELIEKYGDEGYLSKYCFEDKGINIKNLLEISEKVSYKENRTKLKECLSPVFSSTKANQQVNEDGEFMLGSKELLEHIIEVYRTTIVEYYTTVQNIDSLREMCYNPRIDHLEYFIGQCKIKVAEFSGKYFMADSDDILHGSWFYEYDIFNVIHILKTFDWNKNYLLWIGG